MVDKDRTESEALGVEQAFSGHLAMPVEDAFEMLVEVFDGQGTEFVENAAHVYPGIGMRIRSILGSDQETTRLGTDILHIGCVVM